MEMYGLKSGNSFFAITDHAGQQDVAMNGCFSGTLFRKSSASSMVHRSAPMATSTTSAKPSSFNALLTLSGVTLGPNCPTNAGAMAAMTSWPSLIAWIVWKIWPLSTMAPKGQFTRLMPQDTHLS